MRAGIVPAQMLAATVAMTKRPSVTYEPGVLQGRRSGLVARERFGESDNLEPCSLRIAEDEFVFGFVLEPVRLVGDPVETPRAEPIAGCRGYHRRSPGCGARLLNRGSRHCPASRCRFRIQLSCEVPMACRSAVLGHSLMPNF